MTQAPVAFRLIEAHLAGDGGDPDGWTPPEKSKLGAAVKPRFSSLDRSQSGTQVTAVIGNNGTGKSRLFSAIAESFHLLSVRYTAKGLPLDYRHFQVDNNICVVRKNKSHQVVCYLNNQRTALVDLPLPNRVVAMTLTPYDKFPLPRYLARYSEFEPRVYAYLGVRDGTNRASIVSLLYRSVEQIFRTAINSPATDARMCKVLSFLGYKPVLNVNFSFSRNQSILRSIASGSSEEIRGERSAAYQRVQMHIARAPGNWADLVRSARDCLDAAEGSLVNIPVDFSTGEIGTNLVQSILLLRSLRLLNIDAVNLERQDGAVYDLKRASSGELSIVTSFIGLATVIKDASLILIDEPEISLHPEWQRSYTALLLSTFSDYKGCHFALATHSPLILSDVAAASAYAVSLDANTKLNTSAIGGQSPDYLLIRAFRVVSRNNLFLRQEVIKALRLLADGKKNSMEYIAVKHELTEVFSHLSESDPVKKLIGELIFLDVENPNAKT